MTLDHVKYRLVLALGIAATSCAALFIRWAAQDAQPLVTAAARLALAALLLSPALPRALRELRQLPPWRRLATMLAPLALGLHFALWITSLSLTSVASSTIFVTTTPVFMGLGAHYFLKEPLRPGQLAGIALAVAGGVVVTLGDSGTGPQPFLGDIMALAAALGSSAYLLLGRAWRRHLSLPAYTSLAYSGAALLLIAAALGSGGRFTGLSARTYLAFLLLALVPQLIGHTALNYAVRHLSPALVAVSMAGEPIGASALAWTLLQEVPRAMTVLGGVGILAGIYVVARATPTSQTPVIMLRNSGG